MVYRLFVEKKQGLTLEADALKADINGLLGIEGVTDVKLLNRYDAENISFNNVLLLQALYDEFSYFRDYKRNVDENILRIDKLSAYEWCYVLLER